MRGLATGDQFEVPAIPFKKAADPWLIEQLATSRFSLRELGRRAGISHSALANIRNGRSFPGPEILAKLAYALADTHALSEDERTAYVNQVLGKGTQP